MNRAYRTAFEQTVKRLPRTRFGVISHQDCERLDKQIRADFRAGIISDLDAWSCGCVVGYAANLKEQGKGGA